MALELANTADSQGRAAAGRMAADLAGRSHRLAAGREALDWQRILAKTKSNVVAEVLRHQGEFFQWSH